MSRPLLLDDARHGCAHAARLGSKHFYRAAHRRSIPSGPFTIDDDIEHSAQEISRQSFRPPAAFLSAVSRMRREVRPAKMPAFSPHIFRCFLTRQNTALNITSSKSMMLAMHCCCAMMTARYIDSAVPFIMTWSRQQVLAAFREAASQF